MSKDTQFDRWRAALKGAKLDLGERGNPPSGFYRMKRWRNDPQPPFQRTLAIWRSELEGENVFAEINFGRWKILSPDEADELFANPDLVSIPHPLYESVRSGGAWPEVHTTYLRTKDITAGVVWTEEWSRKQLAANVETHNEHGERRAESATTAQENEAARIGHNGPPKGEVELIKERLQSLGDEVAKTLKAWGGKPRDKSEADRCGDFINAMRAIYKDADSKREAEKEPFLNGGREVDAKWKPVKDDAERYAIKLKGIAAEWLEAEQKKAHEAAAAERAKLVEASPSAEYIPPVETPKISIGTGRQVSIKTREMYQVTDPKLFFDHLFEKNIEMSGIMVEAHKLAAKLAANGLPVPGVDRIQQRKAS